MLAVLAQFTYHCQAIEDKLNGLINEPNYLEDLTSERMHSLIKRGVYLTPPESDTREDRRDCLPRNRGNTTSADVVNKLKTLAYLFEQRESLHEKLTEFFQRHYPNLKVPRSESKTP
jgi:hypothetical protein